MHQFQVYTIQQLIRVPYFTDLSVKISRQTIKFKRRPASVITNKNVSGLNREHTLNVQMLPLKNLGVASSKHVGSGGGGEA